MAYLSYNSHHHHLVVTSRHHLTILKKIQDYRANYFPYLDFSLLFVCLLMLDNLNFEISFQKWLVPAI